MMCGVCTVAPGSGDANKNGIIEVTDVLLVLQYIQGADVTFPEPFYGDCLILALDADGSGSIDLLDVIGILGLIQG